MKTLFNWIAALLFAIERLAIRGQAWLDDNYPDAFDDAVTEIEQGFVSDINERRGNTVHLPRRLR